MVFGLSAPVNQLEWNHLCFVVANAADGWLEWDECMSWWTIMGFVVNTVFVCAMGSKSFLIQGAIKINTKQVI